MIGDKNLTKSAILDRPGWSRSLIQKILGEPDERVPMYGRSGEYCIFKEQRVLDAEASDVFLSAQEALAKRKNAAAKAIETKKAKLIDIVNEMRISVIKLSDDKLLNEAICSYNSINSMRDFGGACLSSDQAFLQRITVNFIRHELTSYDANLAVVANKTGGEEAVMLIRKKVYKEIAKAYPDLEEECDRQCFEKEFNNW